MKSLFHVRTFPGYLYHYAFPTLHRCIVSCFAIFSVSSLLPTEHYFRNSWKKKASYYRCPFLDRASFQLFQTSFLFPKAWVIEWRWTEVLTSVRLWCISKTHPTGKWITTVRKHSMHKINIFPLGYEQWSA